MKAKERIWACFLLILLLFPFSSSAADGARVQYDLGVFALAEGDLTTAETHFRAAVEQTPDNPYYHHQLGKTLLQAKRPEDAIGSLETAWEINPAVTGLQFDLGMAYYEAGRYGQAEELFGGLVAEEPSNVLARYYLGMTYFKQGRYGKALPPLIRAGEENTSICDNSFYFAGISHYKTDQPVEALEKLAYVESNAGSERLRQNARQWQEVIRSQQAKKARYDLRLKLGLEYDDNVRLDPVDEDLFADEEDFAATAYFSGTYRFVNTPKRKVGLGYSHYMSRHHDLSEFDLTAGVLTLFYQERLTPDFYVSLQYNPSHYWVDNDHYLRRHQAGPTLLYRFSSQQGLRFSYDYTKNGYLVDTGRSGHDHDFMVDFFSLFPDKKGQVTIGAGYGSRETDDPDYDYDQVLAHLELSYDLPLGMKFVFKAGWDRRKYDNIDSMYGIRRRDDRYSGGIEVSRPLSRNWLELEAVYRYTKNDSNISYYSYDKNVTGLFLTAKF